jgi:N-acetylglucosamine-6-phosphate deacetylase
MNPKRPSERTGFIYVAGQVRSGACGGERAHPLSPVCPADVDEALRLLEAGNGLVRLFTLAPECNPSLATTRRLAREGVAVSAGHTDASLDVLRADAP